jgi:hypothetical protein
LRAQPAKGRSLEARCRALLLAATGAAPASALISSEEGKSGATVTLYDGGNGHLGINAAHPASKFDVRGGEVRVGNSGAACSKNNEGAIRYDDNRLWVCNAKGWQSMAFSGKP